MVTMIKQDYNEHMAQVKSAVVNLFPMLGYGPEATDTFIEENDTGSEHGQWSRLETEAGRALLKTYTAEDTSWHISYLLPDIIPTDWDKRYAIVQEVVTYLTSECVRQKRPAIYITIKEDIPSHNAYFAGMLPQLGFQVRPRAYFTAPPEALGKLMLSPLPHGIQEVEITEDMLRDIANSCFNAFRPYENLHQSPQEEADDRAESYEEFRSHFQTAYVKTWVVLARGERMIAICRGFEENNMLALDEVAVHPDFQGQGLGRYICIRCMQKLREHFGTSDKHYFIGMNRFLTKAWTLYHWLGFKPYELHSRAIFQSSGK